MKKITVVSPCYNEEDNVEICWQTVKAIFEKELPDYEREHIFVDNASSDRTVEILRGIAAGDPSVKVVVNARNFGVFRSTFNGLRHSAGDAHGGPNVLHHCLAVCDWIARDASCGAHQAGNTEGGNFDVSRFHIDPLQKRGSEKQMVAIVLILCNEL